VRKRWARTPHTIDVLLQQNVKPLFFISMDSMLFLNEIRSLIKGMSSLNEMVDAIRAKYHFTEEAAREYVLACAFADSLNLKFM